MSNKAVVSDVYEFTNESVRLDLGSLSNCRIALYLDERSNKSVVTDRTTIDVYWIDDRNVLTKGYINNGSFAQV